MTIRQINLQYDIWCGLSPCRSFSPAITLKSGNGSYITFSSYECAEVDKCYDTKISRLFSVTQ